MRKLLRVGLIEHKKRIRLESVLALGKLKRLLKSVVATAKGDFI